MKIQTLVFLALFVGHAAAPKFDVVCSDEFKHIDYCVFAPGQELLKIEGVGLFPFPEEMDMAGFKATLANEKEKEEFFSHSLGQATEGLEPEAWKIKNFALELNPGEYLSFEGKTHQRPSGRSFQTTQDTFMFKPILVDWITKYKKDVAKLYQKSYEDASNFVIDSLVLNNLYQTYEEPERNPVAPADLFDW